MEEASVKSHHSRNNSNSSEGTMRLQTRDSTRSQCSRPESTHQWMTPLTSWKPKRSRCKAPQWPSRTNKPTVPAKCNYFRIISRYWRRVASTHSRIKNCKSSTRTRIITIARPSTRKRIYRMRTVWASWGKASHGSPSTSRFLRYKERQWAPPCRSNSSKWWCMMSIWERARVRSLVSKDKIITTLTLKPSKSPSVKRSLRTQSRQSNKRCNWWQFSKPRA